MTPSTEKGRAGTLTDCWWEWTAVVSLDGNLAICLKIVRMPTESLTGNFSFQEFIPRDITHTIMKDKGLQDKIVCTTVPPYLQGTCSKTPSRCLKPWVRTYSMCTLFSPLHAYLFTQREHYMASLWHIRVGSTTRIAPWNHY